MIRAIYTDELDKTGDQRRKKTQNPPLSKINHINQNKKTYLLLLFFSLSFLFLSNYFFSCIIIFVYHLVFSHLSYLYFFFISVIFISLSFFSFLLLSDFNFIFFPFCKFFSCVSVACNQLFFSSIAVFSFPNLNLSSFSLDSAL